MAHEITELVRSVAPGGDYPFGDIKDNPNGTLANRMMFTDALQFFQKMMDLAGITPNGLDDNVTNGYQLLDALLEVTTGGDWNTAGITFATVGGIPWANVGSPNYGASYLVTNKVVRLAGQITGSIAPGTTVSLMNLPAAARPAMEVQIPGHYVKSGGTIVATRIYILPNGDVGLSSSETASGVLFSLDGITFRKS